MPAVCLACRHPVGSYDSLCARCWRDVAFIRAPLCDRLGIPLPFDTGGLMISAAAAADPPHYDRARAVAVYGGVMQDLVHAFKYADRHDARDLFGRWLTTAGSELIADADVVVPVPMHRWRLFTRRFNQSAMLAREIARRTGLRLETGALVRTRATPPQVGLSRREREANVAGAFKVSERSKQQIAGRRVLLVDDVITTGSTVDACARVLKSAGAASVDVLALARVTDDALINP
jgi:ComF family protein